MFNQGLTLTLAGMATVFSFLIILVLFISLSSRIILRFFTEKTPVEPAKKPEVPDITVAVAIAAVKARKEGRL